MAYILKFNIISIKYTSQQLTFPFTMEIKCEENIQKSDEIKCKEDKINKSFFFKISKPLVKVEVEAIKSSLVFFSSIVRLFK